MSSCTTQLELFESNDEITILSKELEAVKKQNEKLKKNLFSKHNDLARLCIALKEELDEMRKRMNAVETKVLRNGKSENIDMLETLFQEAYLGSS
jgi:predicted  nucleic acid-binding Zn-ribbon protein